MRPEIGKLVVGIIITGTQCILDWEKNRNEHSFKSNLNEYDKVLNRNEVISEGNQLEKVVFPLLLSSIKNSLVSYWKDLNDLSQKQYKSEQIDQHIKGLQETICNALSKIIELSGSLPTETLKEFWEQFKCKS